MHVKDTTATTPPRSSGVFRNGGGSRPAISWGWHSGRLGCLVKKDSAFFRFTILCTLHRTKTETSKYGTLQDYLFINGLILQLSGHEMTRKGLFEAIGATSRQGIYPRLQAQCWELASWTHAQLMFCRPCRNTLLADRLGPGCDAATVKSNPTLILSCIVLPSLPCILNGPCLGFSNLSSTIM